METTHFRTIQQTWKTDWKMDFGPGQIQIHLVTLYMHCHTLCLSETTWWITVSSISQHRNQTNANNL